MKSANTPSPSQGPDQNAWLHFAEQAKKGIKQLSELIVKHHSQVDFPQIQKLTKELTALYPKIHSQLNPSVRAKLEELIEDLPDFSPDNNSQEDLHLFQTELQTRLKNLSQEW